MKLLTKTIFILCLTLLLTGCKKEYDNIGLNLRDDYLSTADCDTTTLVAYSLRADSINTTNLANGGLAGELKDPVFGYLNTGIYAKYLLSEVGVNFGENAVLDSLVLTIQYAGHYGDTLSDMRLQVYEMTELLSNGTVYYSTTKEPYDNTNLLYNPSSTFRPKPNTIISSASDSLRYPAHLRVRLSDELGQRFMDNPKALKSNDALHEIFKGLYITATTTASPGCILYFNLRGSISAINLYYHNEGGKRRYIFNTPSTTTYYTAATFDHSTSTDQIFRRQVLEGEKDLGKQSLYVQPLGGVRTLICFPYLSETYKGKSQIINKAELVVSAIYDDDGHLLPPSSLNLLMIGENGETAPMIDILVGGTSYFGGTYDEKEQCYRFRITKYVQQIIQQSIPNKGIYLVATAAGYRGNRLVVAGTDPTLDRHIRLDLYYTSY